MWYFSYPAFWLTGQWGGYSPPAPPPWLRYWILSNRTSANLNILDAIARHATPCKNYNFVGFVSKILRRFSWHFGALRYDSLLTVDESHFTLQQFTAGIGTVAMPRGKGLLDKMQNKENTSFSALLRQSCGLEWIQK